MRVIIDGYNLAHASDWLDLKGRPEPKGMRAMLVRLLADYAERSDDRMTVVFDGLPADSRQIAELGNRAGIEVIFSGAEVDADTQIAKMLEYSTGARDALVVSSDREVRAAASRFHARSCPADEFMNHIRQTLAEPAPAPESEPDVKYTGLSEGDVNVWMRIFGFDKDEEKK